MKLCFVTLVIIATLAVVSSPAFAGGKYDNPYIDDGRLAESPMTFEYEVTEVRAFVSEYGLHYLHHYTPVSAEQIVRDWKAAYKAGREISDGFIIIGYVFLKDGGYWSFNCKNKKDRYKVTVDVLPEDNGSILALNTRRIFMTRVLRRRAWSGYQPVGYDGTLRLKAN